MNAVMLDTNAYVAFKNGHANIITIVQQASHIYLNAIVIGELLAGFAHGSRQAQNQQELHQFLHVQRVQVLSIDGMTAEYYAAIYRDLKQKGRPIPTNDLWIAASAQQHRCGLCTFDQHFSFIEQLIIGTTTSDLWA